MTKLKELYLWAKNKFDERIPVYPLPDDEVCGFDIPMMKNVGLMVETDYYNCRDGKNKYKMKLRITTKELSDVRILFADNLGADKIKWIVTIIQAIKKYDEPEAL